MILFSIKFWCVVSFQIANKKLLIVNENKKCKRLKFVM